MNRALLRRLGAAVLAGALVMPLAGCGQQAGSDRGKPLVRILVDPMPQALLVTEELCREFEAAHGAAVEIVKGPSDASEALGLVLQYLGARSSDVDVYQVDVTWPGILAGHLADLGALEGNAAAEHFPSIIANNTVGGELVCLPWFADAGMLYYRTDLLAKHAFDAPPTTWDELETMARKVVEAERQEGRRDFWGYVWQGKAYEGLTCNAVEWFVSHGGAPILGPDGKPALDSTGTAAALERAARWVGTLSPPGVTSYQEEEARQLFQAGNALFMRNWPYAFALAQGEDSVVRGQVGVTTLPGDGNHRGANTLGGWQLAVSKYSRQQELAGQLVLHLTSADSQRRRALGASLLPTRPALYRDDALTSAIPFLAQMEGILANAVPRPTTQAGERYSEVSGTLSREIHRALTGQVPAAQALSAAAAEIERRLN